MKLISIQKVKDGKYLKNYELTYENKSGKQKIFEIVSHHDIKTEEELGNSVSGISIVAFKDGKLLLLHEFRMGVNRFVYNMCAGMKEKGETTEECVARELKEETGLDLKKIIKILPPSYAAVAISDISNQIIVAEVSGTLSSEFTSENEDIHANFYTKEEVAVLIDQGIFSSRAQWLAYSYSIGAYDKLFE